MSGQVDVSRDLRLALYALESGAIDQAQLILALRNWAAGLDQSMSYILSGLGVRDASVLARLEDRIKSELSSTGIDPESSRADGPPTPESRSQSIGSEPTRTYARATRHASADRDALRLAGDPVGTGVGAPRFQVLRHHARGGLGEVFLALDSELNRSVALKELQAHLAHDPDCQDRFLLEAEMTGKLEHPGIVPVYSLGRYADGRPYYAMRLIEGETFREAIDRFHQPGTSELSADDRTLSFQRLLRSLIEACNAVAYAHSRGIVHRDLKPENIMLGRFGETLVVDWGVAKSLADHKAAEDVPVAPHRNESSASLTQPGSVMGTPRYMSPEQAAGDLERIGPASDVYSLGAILYHLLVGHAPFQTGDVRSVLDRVRRGIFPSPRRLRRSIDPTLEAICLKAMALDPGDRHATALDLADEIEAWQADVRYRVEQELALSQVKRSLARFCLERAHKSFERDAHDDGMLWLARALENAPPEPPELERVVRTSLSGWHAGTKLLERSLRHGGEVHAAAFSPEGRRLATACADGTARLWDLSTGSPLSLPLRHEGPVRAVAFHPAGTSLATASDDGMIRRWDALTGETNGESLRCGGPVAAIRFSPDGSRIVAACGPRGFLLWDAATDLPVIQPGPHDTTVLAVAFSPDGITLAVALDNGQVQLWDAATGNLSGEPLAHGGAVPAFAFDQAGQRLLTGCSDGARIWDVPQHALLLTMSPPGEILCVGFRPDGATFATACADGTARLWDSTNGRPIGEPFSHRAAIDRLAFRPDGTMVATASRDGTARLWCAATGLPLGPPLAHGSAIRTLLFSPDGRRLITGGSDATVRCWQAPNPLDGEAERVSSWIRVTTGLEFDEGDAIRRMEGPILWDLRRRLSELGGPPLR